MLQQGSIPILDESADEKAGTYNAGAARQYNGRMGKVDLCRVDTCLAYANARVGVEFPTLLHRAHVRGCQDRDRLV